MLKKVVTSTSIRFNEDDRKLLAALKKKTGVTSDAEIIRLALRSLAKEHAAAPVTAK